MSRRIDPGRVFSEIAATQDDYFRERRDEFVLWVRGLQAASTPREFMRLQLELRDRFAGRQAGIREVNDRLEADKSELKRLARTNPRPLKQLAELQERIQIRERLIIRENVIQHVSRCLADALAWRATGYDRAFFTVMGQGVRVGRFADETGAGPERQAAQQAWDAGALPLFNDMTNCLREGDLTILHSRWPNPQIAIEEVKRSGRRQQRSAQSRRLDHKLRFLSDEYGPLDDGGKPASLWRLPVPYRHRLARLSAVLARARTKGYAEQALNSAIVLTAADLRRIAGQEGDAINWMTRAAEMRGWDVSAPTIFSSSALVRRIQERRHAGSAYLAPVAIYPLCAEDIVDILMGYLDYSVTLNTTALRAAFIARGIDVQFATGPEASQTFLRAGRGGEEVVVPAVLREQLLHELTTIDTLASVVDELLKAMDLGAPDVDRIVVCDDSSAWADAPVHIAA